MGYYKENGGDIMKKWFALLLAIAMLGTTAFAAVDPCPNTTEFPLTEEPITISCLNWAYSYTRGEFKDQMFWSKLEEMTGIHIEFETYYSDIQEKLSLTLASYDLPDMFYKINLSNTNIWKYAQDDVFAPISDYLDVMPSFNYQLENMPGLKKAISMSDGKFYGFPYIVSCDAATTLPIYVNGEWLDALNYETVPNTLEGLEEMLIAARDSDMNGNGEADEIPLIATGITSIYNVFKGSFGLATRGTTASYIDIGPEGDLRFYAVDEGWRDMLSHLNKLYNEKLLYQEIFTADITTMTALGEQNRLFLSPCNIVDYFGETYKEDYIGVYEPFVGPTGEPFYAVSGNPVATQNTFISTTNEYPAETLAMIDWFYSDEGVRTYFMGWEDLTWVRDEEGKVIYSDFVTKNPDGLNSEEVLGSYVPWAGGANPSMAENLYFGNMYKPMAREVAEALKKFGPVETWGNFPYSDADSTRLATLKTDIETYIAEMSAKFITGEASLESDWETYLNTLSTIGLDELMEIYQRGLEAYEANA